MHDIVLSGLIERVFSYSLWVPETICWLQAPPLVSLWHAYLRGLIWASQNLPSTVSSDRLVYVANASIACMLAVHCSGWFSRPNDDHTGWRDAYALMEEVRHPFSSLYLFNEYFDTNALGEIVISRSLDDQTLFHMLKGHFMPIQAANVERRHNPNPRNRRVRTVVNIEHVPIPQQMDLTEE